MHTIKADNAATDMNADKMKKAAAQAAIEYIETGDIVGIGTGSTANHFIDTLAKIKHKIDATVASSKASIERLQLHGIPIMDLNQSGNLRIYVDGTDETTQNRHLIKGGGGALTSEKIIAQASEQFICIADQSKLVDILGVFPLPIEVIPMACSLVAREIVKIGGQPQLRENFSTDHGNVILDIHNLKILDPAKLEMTLNQIPGVVTVGIFALRGADLLLLGGASGVDAYH